MARPLLFVIALLATVTAQAAEKKAPQGSGEDAAVTITATYLDPPEVLQAVGSTFNNAFTVLAIKIEPKGGKPLPVRLDDFFLRSEQTSAHGTPFAASQIAGPGELVVHRQSEDRKNSPVFSPSASGAPPTRGGAIDGSKNEMKGDAAADPAYEQLQKKMLAEKTITEAETGLLFFPLEKEKAKNLVFTYTSPAGRIRITFK